MANNSVSVDVTPSTTSTTWTYGGDVPSSGDISIDADTDVTFKLKNAQGWDWSSTPLTFVTAPPDGVFGTPTIDPQNSNKFTIEDKDTDGTSTGVSHAYCLHATKDGVAYSTDPRFINR